MLSEFHLDPRKQSILKAVVTDYVRTAEPVGSHALVTRYAFGVRSATIRNEMAELAELGYLRQPHTSSGRIPSDLGYRFYVDRLVELARVSGGEAASAREKLALRAAEVELVLGETCRILSDLAHYTSLATHPVVKESKITHVSVAGVGQSKLLAVLVLDNGSVFHELLQIDICWRSLDPVVATNFLMKRLSGLTLESAGDLVPAAIADHPPALVDLLRKMVDFINRELRQVEESDIHLEGASYIVAQPEFKDAERLETVLSVLEQRKALYRMFSSVFLGPEVTVIIGSENPVAAMRDCSFVGAKYRIGGRVAGTIGVVGPTRMDYGRAIAAVGFMAHNLGELLTQLSVM